VCRTFKHPRLCIAVEEPVAPEDAKRPTSPDELFIVFVPPATAPWADEVYGPAREPNDPDAAVLDVTWRGDRIVWRPGFALVYLAGELRDEVQSALVEFAFYEGELRRLEAEMDDREATAADDVSRTQTIDRRDKSHWPRFRATIEALARVRLTFARLAPRLAEEPQGSRSRRLASHLLRRARAEARAEALDARLEACEDLYEGGNDRVADYTGWRTGHVLEVIIVVILLLEVILLCVDLLLRGGE
jgi:hypothetical protein